jgi:hypothetical protein
LGLNTVLAHFFMKQILFHLIRVLFLKRGIWIRIYFNQKTKDFLDKAFFKEIFKTNQKQLMYLGVLHIRDPDSEQIKAIHDNLKEFEPDCIVYEQYIRPQSWVDLREARIKNVLINETIIDKLITTYGESGYADYLGRKSNASTVMIEPTGEEIFDHLLKYYKKEAIFLYHCLKFLKANNQKLKGKPGALEEFFARHAEEYNPLLYTKTGIEITKENFSYYYKKILNHQLSVYSVGLWQFMNVNKFNYFITQKIAKTELYFRDTKVLEGIYELTKKYDKIAVVYGNTHYLSQRKVIKEMYKWLV